MSNRIKKIKVLSTYNNYIYLQYEYSIILYSSFCDLYDYKIYNSICRILEFDYPIKPGHLWPQTINRKYISVSII